MNIVLNQDKLNGTNKKGTNVFHWRGQFNLEFVQYILEKFAQNTSVVCDPFCGSGTVLYECAKRNIKCVGMDINPSAYYISKFFSYANLRESNREILVKNVEKIFENILLRKNITFEDIIKEINENSSDDEICFAINVAFVASKSKNLNANLTKEIWKAFKYVKSQLMNLPTSSNAISVYLKDVRELRKDELKDKFSVIFTSPPYINVFNYHQNYRTAVELLGWNVLDIAQSEIGSNRKNRGNRFKTVVQYCSDMLLALLGFWNALKVDGIIILVLGKTSSVRGIEFYNGEIIRDLIEVTKGFILKECYVRSFKNKFGKEIYEDVIVLEKSSNIFFDEAIGRKVAIKHLNRALSNIKTENDIYVSIQKAIDEIQSIESSPILNIKRM